MSINIIKLNKRFDEQIVFKDFCLQASNGDIIGIKGPSGSGKTTFLRTLCGLDTDFTAQTFVVPKEVSFLFQENRLFEWKNISQNISFVIESIFEKDHIQKEVDKLLKLCYLYDHKEKYPSELSGGMKRRCALCRSFIYPCKLLIMDEPFSGLDQNMKDKIADSFLKLINKNMITIIVTHDVGILDRCNRVIEL